MKSWSKIDLIGLVLLIFGIICALFSSSKILTIFVLLASSLTLSHSLYKSRYQNIKYKRAICHYQAILSASLDGWISWDISNAFVGASKKFKSFFGINTQDISFSDLTASLNSIDANSLILAFNKLKKDGTPFAITVETSSQKQLIEVVGVRMIVNSVESIILWCANKTDFSSKLSSIESSINDLEDENSNLKEILNTIPIPIWRRNEQLEISYCNYAYANSLDSSVENVINYNLQLIPGKLFGKGYSLAENVRKCGKQQSISQFSVIKGERKKLSIYEAPALKEHIIGFALDITETDSLSTDIDRIVTANCDVLELMSTAIAIFAENTKLVFFNSAYQRLTKLEEGWLYSKPTFAEVLDERRNNRQLPEHADYQEFKKMQLSLFTSITSTIQDLQHLPNGKTHRTVIAPYSLGGLMFMYEDVTDSLLLQRQNNTLLAVQKETIDNLYEAIAVYGSNNRLKIVNNAFKKMWNFEDKDNKALQEVHISEILDNIRGMLDYGEDWDNFKQNAISNLTDRISKTGKLLKNDNSVILFSYIPLPDGAHMHSYMDITATCLVEQAVNEKNEAVKIAQKLRYEFVSCISTELREPLNILMGFTDLLMHQYFGSLNAKQVEYCQCIITSANQLHQMVCNLLEMVSADIGSIKLESALFSIEESINDVVAAVSNRAIEKGVSITSKSECDGLQFFGDKKRIKQCVFNILINSINATPPGSHINVLLTTYENKIKIIVKDGSPVTFSKKKKIFVRSSSAKYVNFSNNANSNSITMPLVKSLIELHGGTLSISSENGNLGITVVCSLPMTNSKILESSIKKGKLIEASEQNIDDIDHKIENDKKIANS